VWLARQKRGVFTRRALLLKAIVVASREIKLCLVSLDAFTSMCAMAFITA